MPKLMRKHGEDHLYYYDEVLIKADPSAFEILDGAGMSAPAPAPAPAPKTRKPRAAKTVTPEPEVEVEAAFALVEFTPETIDDFDG